MLKLLKMLVGLDLLFVLAMVIILVTRDKSNSYSGWIIAWPLLLAVITTVLLGLLSLVYIIKKLIGTR